MKKKKRKIEENTKLLYLLSLDETSMPSSGCVLAKLIRSPNDKCFTTCDKLNADDEYGCTS